MANQRIANSSTGEIRGGIKLMNPQINFETKTDRELLLHVVQTVNDLCDDVKEHNRDIIRLKITLYVLAALTLGTGGTVVARILGV